MKVIMKRKKQNPNQTHYTNDVNLVSYQLKNVQLCSKDVIKAKINSSFFTLILQY